MSEELIRVFEIGIAGLALTMVVFVLGFFRVEFLGVVFSLTTLAGQTVVACLEQFGGTPINPGQIDPHS
jgi:hypothetical protein